VAQKSVAYTTLTVSFSVAKLALSLLLVFFWRREIASLLWAWALTDLVLVPFIAGRLSLPNHVRHAKWSSVKSYFEEFIAYGTPFVISSGAWATLSIVDRFVIQHFRGSAEVGLYYVGSVPNLGFSFIFTLLAFASYPIIVDTWEKAGSEPTQELIKGLLRLYFMLSVPLVVGVSILSKEIIGVLAAPQYLSAYKVVPLVALGGFFQGLLPFTTKSFVLLKKPALNMAIGLVGAMSTLLLNILFIPSLGFLGAGLAMSISYLLVVALSIVISKKVLHFSYHISLASLGRICLGSVIIIPGVAGLSQWCPHLNDLFGLVVKSIGGASIYFIALLAMREASLEDLLALSRLLISRR
jgi:O-antigen/teichoic acid export membrane protein